MTPPAAAGTARVRRSPAPRVPRRVSGPAAKPRLAPRPAPARLPTLARPFARIADARALDAIIHGRYWIPIVAFGLLGIVFMQVSMLKLNAGIGRSVEQTALLARENQLLRAEASRLDAGARIKGLAERSGMLTPSADGFHYLTATGSAEMAAKAAASIARPNPVTPGSTLAAVAPVAPVAPVDPTTAAPTSTAPAVPAGAAPQPTQAPAAPVTQQPAAGASPAPPATTAGAQQ